MGPLLFSAKAMAIWRSSVHFSISDRELRTEVASAFQTVESQRQTVQVGFRSYLAATMMDCRWPRRVRQWGTPHSSSLSSICGRVVKSLVSSQPGTCCICRHQTGYQARQSSERPRGHRRPSHSQGRSQKG